MFCILFAGRGEVPEESVKGLVVSVKVMGMQVHIQVRLVQQNYSK